ncbi:MAG: RagB/SusD family nutrient uptake outer membrane protein, partial [Sphingobacteriaceae bacterium]
ASWAFSSAITQTGDGYGSLAPSFDLVDAFASFSPDTTRRHATIMLPGSYYPEINKAGGGYTLPLNASSGGTHAQAKKYVVGSPADNSGKSAAQASGNNTYIMRYADVFLIAAEAIMGQQSGTAVGKGIDTNYTTTDATALNYLNMVRVRSKLPAVTRVSYRNLIKERRLEFALEQDYWFDLCRLDGFNSSSHPVAISIISKQDRGNSSGGTAPTYKDFVRYSTFATPTNASFLFPIPVSETTADPNLLAPPVPYVFK